ncbi:hypothetical protein BDQ17DRAFT_1388899 [Cyathus striatus]|nr:hypothetical protein BDQ17DRAFT_1388899 [Cyathus striatus]
MLDMVIGKQALWDSGHDETVEVNQRALIDKVLARYSGEFTVFRELLQNSDDARASAVEIRFQTKSFLDQKTSDNHDDELGRGTRIDEEMPNLRIKDVHQWSFRNNGIHFRDEDWSRLKKIAEGNPDEEKIGAFGVVTEEPFDGKDQLFARRGKLPDPQPSSTWTTFDMRLREPCPMPVAFDFTRFLASSITFMTICSKLVLAKLSKSTNLLPLKTMMVTGIKATRTLHINAEVMSAPQGIKSTKTGNNGGFFSSLLSTITGTGVNPRAAPSLPPIPVETHDPAAISNSNVALSIFSAEIKVTVDKKLSSELQRSTKKNPPAKMKYELIYTTKEEYDASKEEDRSQKFATGSGHATAQTTGLGGHMAARFIPTVNPSVWNKELLYVGGFLARAAYEFELNNIRNAWRMSNKDALETSQQLLIARALHAMKFFSFHQSTPSVEVSSQLEAAFFTCSSNNRFPLISTSGVSDSSDVRLPNPELGKFMKHLPILPENVRDDAQIMVTSLQARGLIKEIEFEDILGELRARPLSEDEMILCLKWWIGESKGDALRLLSFRSRLIDAALRVVPLSSVKTFVNPKMPGGIVPLEGPIPAHVLPIAISKAISVDTIAKTFPWTELSLVEWLTHVCSSTLVKENAEFNLNVSATWSERVLQHLARAWPAIPNQSKETVVSLMKSKTCIPTSRGMKLPEDAYFASVNIFNDLPIVALPNGAMTKGSLEKVLEALGVRKHVDLQIIFNRMIKTNEWTIADLVKYLVSVKSTLTADEMKKLEATAAFPCEANADITSSHKSNRFRAEELYEPLDAFRQLGLPVIDWGKQVKWRGSSDEAKFLYQLGLRRYPPLETLIGLCASPLDIVRSTALKYLLDNISTKYEAYSPEAFKDVQYIPAVRGTEYRLGSPQENEAQAKTWFTILSTRVNDFLSPELTRLSKAAMVPVKRLDEDVGPNTRWLAPSQCYLAGQARDQFHSKLFVYVDFGVAGNAFLTACGARHEPSIEEVAKTLLLNPRRFYELSQGPLQFLAELRNIAVNSRLLSSGTLLRMKNSSVLLGSKRNNTIGDHDMNEDDNLLYDLKKPDQIIIADDTQAYQAFGDSLFTAPQEDILERFYIQLGSKRLSSIVKEEYHTIAEVPNLKVISDTRALVLERLPLFLHEHTHAATRVTYSWLSSGNNFVVKTFGKISLTKSLNFGEIKLSRNKMRQLGAIQLWLSGNTQVDMYDCNFSQSITIPSPKTNDALLFMTILSTDLKALKRRGYNGSTVFNHRHVHRRILRQQKTDREASEALKRNQKAIDLVSLPPKPDNRNPPLSNNGLSKDLEQPDAPGSFPDRSIGPSSSVINSFNNLRRKIGSSLTPPDANPKASSHLEQAMQRPLTPSSRSSGPVVTPLSNISSNIELAIHACKPESSDFLNEGYCDVSGRAGNLHLIGEMGGVKVYLSQEMAKDEAQHFMQKKHDVLARFIHIIASLAKLYTLPLQSLHVFSDLEGGLIAFNRNGSVFLNLRYYEAWHDSEVQSGKTSTAFISWYFTLAHEIAHNLVHPHNSEHEFYFSAICEKYIMGLGELI